MLDLFILKCLREDHTEISWNPWGSVWIRVFFLRHNQTQILHLNCNTLILITPRKLQWASDWEGLYPLREREKRSDCRQRQPEEKRNTKLKWRESKSATLFTAHTVMACLLGFLNYKCWKSPQWSMKWGEGIFHLTRHIWLQKHKYSLQRQQVRIQKEPHLKSCSRAWSFVLKPLLYIYIYFLWGVFCFHPIIILKFTAFQEL